MSDNRFGFGEVRQKIIAMKEELPIVLANQAQNHFVGSWQRQGWDGKAWKEVNRRIPGTNEYKYPKNYGLGRRTSAILVSSGRARGVSGGTLRRVVGNSIRSKRFDNIRLVVDIPYAAYLNDGTDNMVARSFMKDSATLIRLQVAKINEFTNRIWR